MVIDWAIGTQGNPTADLARTWLISKIWLGELEQKKATAHLQVTWQRFWERYFHTYGELRTFSIEEMSQWCIVAVATSLVWGPTAAEVDQRISFIEAALDDAGYLWLS